MQPLCSSDVLLDLVGRIAYADHVNCYWRSRGVGSIGYYNDFFREINMDLFRFPGQDEWY